MRTLDLARLTSSRQLSLHVTLCTPPPLHQVDEGRSVLGAALESVVAYAEPWSRNDFAARREEDSVDGELQADAGISGAHLLQRAVRAQAERLSARAAAVNRYGEAEASAVQKMVEKVRNSWPCGLIWWACIVVMDGSPSR